jgi:hypothetical protein
MLIYYGIKKHIVHRYNVFAIAVPRERKIWGSTMDEITEEEKICHM